MAAVEKGQDNAGPAESRLKYGQWSLWDRDPAAKLPERIRRLVQAQDRDSERLIIFVQFALAISLGALYLTIPRPADSPMRLLAPVPLALAGYFLFTVLRFGLSRHGPLPEWFLMPSIVTDMALLLGLIWSFHAEYGEQPPLSLKVPTFAYLFVFIALRALRFHHRFVFAAGLSAAIGWAVLTVLAVMLSPDGTVTRSFVAYVNGGGILIGAEVDKIIALLLVTGILMLAARRAQVTLVAAVRDQAAVQEIGRFLSLGVAAKISGADTRIEAGQAVERDAAILFLDIRGFTPFAMHVPPAEVVRVLTGFHARITPIVRANSGVIDKFLGDGVMATFGAVEASPTAAANALRALDAIMAEARRWQEDAPADSPEKGLSVNGAAAYGAVVFAAVGGGGRLEYTVIGEAVNLAAKLEKHNKVAGTRALVPAAMVEVASQQGYVDERAWRRVPLASVAGVSVAVDLAATEI